MSAFRDVTGNFLVSPQIALGDVAEAKSLGIGLIINNRPDGESVDQPNGAVIESAARAQGISYVYIPVVGRPTDDQADAFSRAISAAKGKCLAYCRSGNRSIMTWAMGEMASGARTRGELVRLAAAAGYDLSNALPP